MAVIAWIIGLQRISDPKFLPLTSAAGICWVFSQANGASLAVLSPNFCINHVACLEHWGMNFSPILFSREHVELPSMRPHVAVVKIHGHISDAAPERLYQWTSGLVDLWHHEQSYTGIRNVSRSVGPLLDY